MTTKIRSLIAAAVLAAGLLVTMAAPVGAAEASGCSGSGVSFADDGGRLDTAAAPGRGGTKEDPFDVVSDGQVKYTYDVDAPVAGGTWKVKINTGLVPISFGGDISDSSDQSGRGVEYLEEHLQVGGFAPLTGLLKVDIEATGPSGETCIVSGWLELHDSVFTTPLFYLALVMMLLGIFLLGFGQVGFW